MCAACRPTHSCGPAVDSQKLEQTLRTWTNFMTRLINNRSRHVSFSNVIAAYTSVSDASNPPFVVAPELQRFTLFIVLLPSTRLNIVVRSTFAVAISIIEPQKLD